MEIGYQIWSLIRFSSDKVSQKGVEVDEREQVLLGKFYTYKEAKDAQNLLAVDTVYNYMKEVLCGGDCGNVYKFEDLNSTCNGDSLCKECMCIFLSENEISQEHSE